MVLLASVILRLIDFYSMLILVWCIMSWVPAPRGGVAADIMGAIDSLVRPYIDLFRTFLPTFGGLDFSPILAIMALRVAERLIIGILW